MKRYSIAIAILCLIVLNLEGYLSNETIEEKISRIMKDPEFEESVGLNPKEIIWPYDYVEDGNLEKGVEIDPIHFNTEGKLHNFKITVISNISITLYLSRKENPSHTNYEFKSESGKTSKIYIYPTDGSTGDFYLAIIPTREGKASYTLKIEPSFNWFMYMLIFGVAFVLLILRHSSVLTYMIDRYVYFPKWFYGVLVVTISIKVAINDRIELITMLVGLYLVFLGYRGRLFVTTFALFYYLMDMDALIILCNYITKTYHLQKSDFFYFVIYHERLIWLYIMLTIFYTVFSEAIYRKKELNKLFGKSVFYFSFSFWLTNLLSLNLFYFFLSNFRALSSSLYYFSLFAPTLLFSYFSVDRTMRKYYLLVLTNGYGAFMLVHYIVDPYHKLFLGLFWFVFGFIFQFWNGDISQDDHSISSKNIIDNLSTLEHSVVAFSSSSEENSEILSRTLNDAFENRKNSPNYLWEDIFKSSYIKAKKENQKFPS
eukprot:TRINITY_DN2705_c0_g1_i1.p1 TRINITY_DN2705_c0_g1~~TRINITY_DN2705_c0_g1_i1.p1  ORF type:complete len:485 (-),score=86.16 TRINITY_DN2705_c0_g1_i1:614-2068(-)